MPEAQTSHADACQALAEELFSHGLLIPQGARGLYGIGPVMDAVMTGIDRLITTAGATDQPELMRFPPLISRRVLERSAYLHSFPTLAGPVQAFSGDERNHAKLLQLLDSGGDWSKCCEATDLVLAPAACYAVYPVLTGTLPAHGRLIDVLSFAYRHEPSDDPTRLQVFRLREQVHAGDPESCRRHSIRWVERGLALLRSLGLPAESVVGSDPFFGRTGRMLAVNQKDQELKVELVVPICSEDQPTACGSCNYHRDHFGLAFGIHTAAGGTAHSACVGFGLERIALALFRHHGFRPGNWPVAIRRQLAL